jgi:hypothetical protein
MNQDKVSSMGGMIEKEREKVLLDCKNYGGAHSL